MTTPTERVAYQLKVDDLLNCVHHSLVLRFLLDLLHDNLCNTKEIDSLTLPFSGKDNGDIS